WARRTSSCREVQVGIPLGNRSTVRPAARHDKILRTRPQRSALDSDLGRPVTHIHVRFGGLAVAPIAPREILGDIDGGKVLDVATGAGGFLRFLIEGLRGYDSIVGIEQLGRACGHLCARVSRSARY